MSAALISALRARLATVSRRTLPTHSRARKAAVLCNIIVPASDPAGEPHIIFTERSHNVGTHRGQVSFPGGHIEPNESAAAAALRETREEIGLVVPEGDVAGLFHDVIAITGTHVTPVLAHMQQPVDVSALVGCNHEVATIFTLSLRHLCDPANSKLQYLPPVADAGGDGKVKHRTGIWAPVFMGGPAPIWGLTASMLLALLRDVIVPAAHATGDPTLAALRHLPIAFDDRLPSPLRAPDSGWTADSIAAALAPPALR